MYNDFARTNTIGHIKIPEEELKAQLLAIGEDKKREYNDKIRLKRFTLQEELR